MIGEMFGEKIAKDFSKGIASFAKEFEVLEKDVQVRLTFGENEESLINYQVCCSWKIQRGTNYKEIMGLKIDILGQENMVVPYIYKSMVANCQGLQIEMNAFSSFLYKREDGKIGVAIFDGSTHKKITTISELLSSLS
jgi:hypothetical protein